MVLFLKANTNYIPIKIPEISPGVEKKLLSRLPQWFDGDPEKELLGFKSSAPDSDKESDTNAGIWDKLSE